LAAAGPVPPHPPLPLGHVVGPVYNVPAHTVVTGGMPGWWPALIAAAATLAAVAVLLDLARAAPDDDHGGHLSDARTQAIRVIPRPDDPGPPRTSPAPPARQQTPIQRSR
jgi:hypothetical protein